MLNMGIEIQVIDGVHLIKYKINWITDVYAVINCIILYHS